MVLVETRSDFTVFLNSAIEAPNSDWVGELVGAAAQKGRGLVGGFICDSKGTIVEAGYSVQAGRPVPLFKGLTPAQWTYAGVAGWPRNLVVPPINCCVVRTASIPAAVTDPAELAVRLHRQGLHNVAWPFVRLTLDAANTIEPSLAVSGPDPYLNPNLIVADGVPTLRS